MYERLKRLYKEGKITQHGLHWWVGRGITEEEYQRIISEDTEA